MPLTTTTTFESLPCSSPPPPHLQSNSRKNRHRPPPPPTALTSARELISSSLPIPLPTHPRLPPCPLLNGFDPSSRAPKKLKAINTTPYESLDTPSPDTSVEAIENALRLSGITCTYLRLRVRRLQNLENGAKAKEEWLAANSHTAGVLRGVEKELAEEKEAIDLVVAERRDTQDRVAAELQVLECSWRAGVARVLETAVAAEGLRRERLAVEGA
ncbi:hypothetical protein VC83_06221 [Pseudogymnoascus destructans]|uniref:Pre-mRNA-splicing factor SPF27 n=1 Tax=Pseudogymnoascus destructans TaxID=655981 RepID=A0A177A9L2_9PEZI|nr:uncharacterized protein VC83_06221 [Pseudogymnoascus destructans]OAF58807.1 hypothetical protein VC83_06221 [Pseudogymnoascus destructans]